MKPYDEERIKEIKKQLKELQEAFDIALEENNRLRNIINKNKWKEIK